MRYPGIKVWVLTGDKVETAVEIGVATGLIDDDMKKHYITELSVENLRDQLINIKEQVKFDKNSNEKIGIIVAGESLSIISKETVLKELMLESSDMADVVLACRVSPKQKAEIVMMVR